jgi:hypothetical protein
VKKRPVAVVVIACVYILTSLVEIPYHLMEARGAFERDMVWAALVNLLPGVAGWFLLRGHNWARWLAVAWIAFHVGLSFFNSWGQTAIHALFCALIAYFLFRRESEEYFRA